VGYAKIGAQSFAKKPAKAKRKVVEDYWRFKGETRTPSDGEVEHQAGRMSVAQPEMMVFKFFKAMMDPGKVEAVGEDGARLASRHRLTPQTQKQRRCEAVKRFGVELDAVGPCGSRLLRWQRSPTNERESFDSMTTPSTTTAATLKSFLWMARALKCHD